eukprot:gene7708-9482_t
MDHHSSSSSLKTRTITTSPQSGIKKQPQKATIDNSKNGNNQAGSKPLAPPDPYYVLRGHKHFINAVVFDKQNQNILYSGSGDGEIKVWNIEEKKCIKTEIAHREGGVLSLQYTPYGIVSQGRDGTVKIWNYVDNDFKQLYKIETNSISLGKCSSHLTSTPISVDNINNSTTTTTTTTGSNPFLQNNLLAISSDETPSQVEIWDLHNREIVSKLNPKKELEKLGLSMSLKLFSDSDGSSMKLCSGYENGTMLMWDIRNSGADVIASGKLHTEPILAFDLKGNNGVSGSGDSYIVEFNVNYESKQFDIISKHMLKNNGISDVKIRSDEKIYATSGWDRRVRIYNLKKHCPLAILKFHTDSIYSLDFSTDYILATASKDLKIALWSIYREVKKE